MLKQLTTILIIAFWACNFALGQNDPVLFTVENTPITVSEFKYIYTKTNGEKADFSKKTLDEYLDLYTKFKLKVQRAKDMKLDTIKSLQTELDGYRRQLADSYLIDREVTDRLTREVYDRMLKDINVSHIFVGLQKGATPIDTMAAYNKIMDALHRLQKGESWATVCKEISEDKNSKDTGGNLNYLTAMLPDGFYDLEAAMYNTPQGSYSMPMRSPVGYHIIRVEDSRAARGEMEVAHILFRNSKEKPNPSAQVRIDSCYVALVAGANFEELAKAVSEDNTTNKKGGYIGFFGINRYEKAFEEAAFALSKDGEYTKPIETAAGWHIIKRITRKPMDVYEVAKNRLKPRLQRDSRFDLAKRSMIERIKKDGQLKENPVILESLITQLSADTNFLSFRWKAPEKSNTELFSFANGARKFTVADFNEYLFTNSRKRMESGNNAKTADVVNKMYNDFVSESCLKYEETQLDKKYPEFKSLMREYEEGILLFEATKNQVWDKASQDSIGLQKFYDEYKQKYMWEDRTVVNFYALQDSAKGEIEKLRKYAADHDVKEVLAKFNKKGNFVSNREETIEKGKNKVLDAMPWKVGALSGVEVNKKDNSLNFIKIEKTIPRSQKELKDARGYVVADYQDYLERQWIDDLRRMYKVNVNQDVLNSLVK